MFQNLRQGSQVYIIHTAKAELQVEMGVIETTNAMMFGMYPMNFPLELTVRIGNRVVPYKGINGSTESAKATEQTSGEEIVICCSRDAVNTEIARLKQESINNLNMAEFHRQRIASCDSIHMQVNPEEAQKAQQQAELESMRSQMESMRKQMAEQMEINKKLLAKLEDEETPSIQTRKE